MYRAWAFLKIGWGLRLIVFWFPANRPKKVLYFETNPFVYCGSVMLGATHGERRTELLLEMPIDPSQRLKNLAGITKGSPKRHLLGKET